MPTGSEYLSASPQAQFRLLCLYRLRRHKSHGELRGRSVINHARDSREIPNKQGTKTESSLLALWAATCQHSATVLLSGNGPLFSRIIFFHHLEVYPNLPHLSRLIRANHRSSGSPNKPKDHRVNNRMLSGDTFDPPSKLCSPCKDKEHSPNTVLLRRTVHHEAPHSMPVSFP